MSKIFKPLLLSALVAGAANVQAESAVSFIPSAGISQKSLQYGFDFGSGTDVANASFIGLNVGVIAAFESFYISAELDQGLTEGALDNNFGADVSSDAMTITAGCNCLAGAEALTVFAGYTSIDILAESTDGTNSQFDDNHSGLFFGASYPIISSDSGQLSATLAYASLSGESILSSGGASATLSGDTTGLSYGLAWSGVLSEQLNYSISAKINDYAFDVNTLTNATGTGPVSLNFDRIFTILGAKVTYFF